MLAIDLYGGKVTNDPKQAGELMQSIDQDKANAKLKAALDYLKSSDRKVATLGWCFGGGQSLQASLVDPDAVSATVIYYGELVADEKQLKTLQAPLLGIFALNDDWITPEKVETFTATMADLAKSIEIRSFDADHAFANPSSPNYHSDAAREAWLITDGFLAYHLKGIKSGSREEGIWI